MMKLTAVDRGKFFSLVKGNLFDKLSQDQVNNLEVILSLWEEKYPGVDVRWVANYLAQVYHETRRTMAPVREAFGNSDGQTISRLDRAYANNKLPWVRRPYWRDGWFGRGPLQITHFSNYKKMEERTKYPLVQNRDLMLDPRIGNEVSMIGAVEGLFTGKKFSDFFSETKNDILGARRIVNGSDGTDARVADYHRKFLVALEGSLVGEVRGA